MNNIKRLSQVREFLGSLADLAHTDGDIDLLEWREAVDNLDHVFLELELSEYTDPENGMVWVSVWGRDCDMCESTRMYDIEPTVEAFKALEDMVYDSAEGPTAINLLTPKEAREFEPSMRDRALEAYENGRGANAYSV